MVVGTMEHDASVLCFSLLYNFLNLNLYIIYLSNTIWLEFDESFAEV